MSQCNVINVEELKNLCSADAVVFVDIREKDEHRCEHIVDSECISLSDVSNESLSRIPADKTVVFYCQSGNRTGQAAVQFSELNCQSCILDGGISAWKKAGGKTIVDAKAPLPIMRQVQIVAGLLILIGIVLSYLVSPYFNLLSGFVGAGLLFAGVSGFCGMANILNLLPYNKRK